VIDDIVDIGRPILVITGGDPLMRADVFAIMQRAAQRGLRVAFSPSATGRCTAEPLQRAKDCGVSRVHISLDGADAETHDRFRGVRGSFQRTREILSDIARLEIPLQIGTTVSRYSLAQLEDIRTIVASSGALMWSLFFLVPTGRGQQEDMISAEAHEAVFNWLYDIGQDASFDVRTTAAMHYRRVVLQRRRSEASSPGAAFPNVSGAGFSAGGGMGMSARGVNDGDGFAFIDHLGNVCPSGFLQVPAGNVREQRLADIYRDSRLFRDLRDRSLLKGKCGVCEFRSVCGGSRARAYAMTGDYLESDPSCIYQPPGRDQEC
jgi:AdoMet-dependent heme synthase